MRIRGISGPGTAPEGPRSPYLPERLEGRCMGPGPWAVKTQPEFKARAYCQPGRRSFRGLLLNFHLGAAFSWPPLSLQLKCSFSNLKRKLSTPAPYSINSLFFAPLGILSLFKVRRRTKFNQRHIKSIDCMDTLDLALSINLGWTL